MNSLINEINSLIQRRQLGEAAGLCDQFIAAYPKNATGWFRLGQIRQINCDFDGMLECARRVIAIMPDAPAGYLQEIDALIHGGRADEAVLKIAAQEKRSKDDVQTLNQLADFYTHAGQFEAAGRCYQRTRELWPTEPKLLYNCAASAIALGKLDEAEDLFNQVLDMDPHDYDAYYNRATLRKQTAENNHIEELLSCIKDGIRNPAGEVKVYYALAKVYEDIGEHKKSFASLTKGADRRNSMLQYDVAEDVDAMAAIKEVMSDNFFEDGVIVDDDPGPIFIMGLPRSGTTLVDRIVSSHSAVDSLGEINDFALSLMGEIGPSKGKLDLIAKSAHMDFEKLGAKYLSSIQARNGNAAYLIDKTPANFLYIGLIAKALPNAKILHMRRNPMDSCYAMYKTLFRMGYPFSYSLDNLARYYEAYDALMRHWQAMLPGRVYDIDYENLVQNPEQVSRNIVTHCGFDWQAECLDFHLNKSPTATASAAQVRRPINRDSVEKWRAYTNELQPLKQALEAAGFKIKKASAEL